MTTNTGFVITDVGNAAATVATPAGPFVHITQFRVGSAFNYTPVASDTGLHGSTLFTGGVTNYYVVDNDTIELILVVDATVGPFFFGEVGIYLADGSLFALCAFDTLQEKIRAVGPQAGMQWRIRARLKLANAPVICQVDVFTGNQILEVSAWQFLKTPINQTGDANMAIVMEPNSVGDSVLVYKDNDNKWGINDYSLMIAGSTGSGAVIGTDVITDTQLEALELTLPRTDSRYLIKFPDGDIRKIVSQPSSTQVGFSPGKAVPLSGTYEIWQESGGGAVGKVRWADRQEYNDTASLVNLITASSSGVFPTNNLGMGQTPIPLILTSRHPSKADWLKIQTRVIQAAHIHSADPSNVVLNTDYAYTLNSNDGTGLSTHATQYQSLQNTILNVLNNRNVIDPTFQEVQLNSVVHTRTLPWAGTLVQSVSLTFASADALRCIVNSGFELTEVPAVTSGNSANWLGLKNLYAAIGSVIVSRATTFSTGGVGSPSSFGFLNMPTVFTQLYTHTLVIAGGPATMTVFGRLNGAVAEFEYHFFNTSSGYYTSGVVDNFTTRIHMRKPSSSFLTQPPLPYPAPFGNSNF